MAEDTTYNGWRNYETWNVVLWLSNDEALYYRYRELLSARKCQCAWHCVEAYNVVLRALLEDHTTRYSDWSLEDIPALTTGDGVRYDDSKIDRREVGAALLED